MLQQILFHMYNLGSCSQLWSTHWRMVETKALPDVKSLIQVETILRQQTRFTLSSLLPILGQAVGIMESASFRQVAVDVIGSHRQLSSAPSDQIVKDDVFIKHFKGQNGTLRGGIVGELLVPPGILVVVTDNGLTQRGRTTENLDVGICDPEDVRGKTTGVQVVHSELGLSHSQTAHNQQEEGETGGHGSSGCCGERAANVVRSDIIEVFSYLLLISSDCCWRRNVHVTLKCALYCTAKPPSGKSGFAKR